MSIANPNQRDLDQVYLDNLRIHKMGETDGFTPDIAEDLGFGPADITNVLPDPEFPSAPIDRTENGDYITHDKRPWRQNRVTTVDKAIGAVGLAGARTSSMKVK